MNILEVPSLGNDVIESKVSFGFKTLWTRVRLVWKFLAANSKLILAILTADAYFPQLSEDLELFHHAVRQVWPRSCSYHIRVEKWD